MLLKIATVLLCLILSVSLLATMLVLDLRQLTSKSGLEQVAQDLLCEQPTAIGPIRATASLGEVALPEQLPAEMDQESLVAWFYEAMEAQYGADLKVSQEQMQTFLEQSTAKDFVVDKFSSYASDLVNGTRNTTITEEEILTLMDENLALVEETFNVKVDRNLRGSVAGFLKENDIDTMVRTQVIEQIENIELPGVTPMLGTLTEPTGGVYTVADLLAELRIVTSPAALTILIVLDLLLIALLLLTNRLRIGPTLISAGVPALIIGIVLSLPVALIQLLPVLLGDSLGLAAILVNLIGALAARIAPVHYGTAAAGLLLIIAGSIIKAVSKKQMAPQTALS